MVYLNPQLPPINQRPDKTNDRMATTTRANTRPMPNGRTHPHMITHQRNPNKQMPHFSPGNNDLGYNQRRWNQDQRVCLDHSTQTISHQPQAVKTRLAKTATTGPQSMESMEKRNTATPEQQRERPSTTTTPTRPSSLALPPWTSPSATSPCVWTSRRGELPKSRLFHECRAIRHVARLRHAPTDLPRPRRLARLRS